MVHHTKLHLRGGQQSFLSSLLSQLSAGIPRTYRVAIHLPKQMQPGTIESGILGLFLCTLALKMFLIFFLNILFLEPLVPKSNRHRRSVIVELKRKSIE